MVRESFCLAASDRTGLTTEILFDDFGLTYKGKFKQLGVVDNKNGLTFRFYFFPVTTPS